MNQIPHRRTGKSKNSANPLFEQWLEEWRLEASNKDLDLQYGYKNALISLRKYPLRLNSGAECLILKNFGRQLCAKLDKKLAEHRLTDSGPSLENAQSALIAPSVSIQKVAVAGNKRKAESLSASSTRRDVSSPRKKKAYIPTARSGGYAILTALLRHKNSVPNEAFMRRTELIEEAQQFCDVSFTKSENANYYTAWSSMSTLIKKGLVSKMGCPAKFSLTKEGEELAAKLSCDGSKSPVSSIYKQFSTSSANEDENCSKLCTASSHQLFSNYSPTLPGSPSLSRSSSSFNLCDTGYSISPLKSSSSNSIGNNCIDLTDDASENRSDGNPFSHDSASTCSSSTNLNTNSGPFSEANHFEQIIFVPGEFEIILLVDIRETSGKTKNPMSDDTIRALTNLKIKFETRQLSVGDFVWIARDRSGKELLLPYITERKRMDDLASSIKDGRFHEQKFRLRQCGLQNVIYLIEKYGKEIGFGLPINTLHQAVVNSQLVDSFYVKTTNKHSHSMTYLSVFTKLLTEFFKDKTLISCSKNDLPPFNIKDDIISLITFTEFSKSSVKNKNLKIHEMFIKQLVQLKGLSAEKAVAITQKYPTPRDLIAGFKNSNNPPMLLSNLSFGVTNRNIGPTISKTIFKLYSDEQFE